MTPLAPLALVLLAAGASATELEEVLVTATRADTSLRDYAGSATRLDATTLREIGATHHSEVINQVPGAFIQRGSGQESLTALRSPVLTGAGSCGAFLFLEDGIPLRPAGFCNVNQLFEVNSEQAAAIEVLRGPGTALYGSNAVHGIINVINPRPADLSAASLGLEAGDASYVRLKGALSGATPWGEAGLVAHATHDGGWREAAGFEEQKLAASLVRGAGDGTLTLRLNATNLNQETAGFIVGENAYRDRGIARSNPNPEAFRDAWSLRSTAHYAATAGNGDAVNARLVLRSSRMEFLQHFLLGQPLERNGQDSVGVLLSRTMATPAGGEVTLGLDGEFANGFLVEDQDGPTTGGPPAAIAIRPAGLHYDYEVNSMLVAPYVQWQQQLWERLTLTAGLRLEWLRYDYDNRMLDGDTDENGVPCTPGPCLYSRPADRSDRFANFGPRLGASWRLGEYSALWTSLTQGFRPPEATELYRLQRGQQVADLSSEQIDGVEVGFRRAQPGRYLEVAAFWMDKDNVILRDAFGFNFSGGRTRHTGIEYGFDWALGAGWTVGASGTVARHTYEFSANLSGEQVSRGDDVDTAPRQLHSLRVGYVRGSVAAGVEWLHVGPYWADAANTARYPGHDVLNLRLGWRATDALAIALRITNLTDVAYADRADFAFGNYRYFPGRPRAAFVEVSWRRD